ncbi:MAG: hypothetical protein ACPIOQ_47090, partial [Promethearchaeia archaeon]
PMIGNRLPQKGKSERDLFVQDCLRTRPQLSISFSGFVSLLPRVLDRNEHHPVDSWKIASPKE